VKLLLILGSVAVPLFMVGLQKKWPRHEVIFHLLAILAALTFGNISAINIYEVLVNNTVFMTTIHSIFLKPLFLISGAYLGVYMVYLMIFWTLKRLNK
jgi:hypothetical protein